MDLDCKDGTCPIDGNKGNQTIRSGKSCLPCSGYKRYSTSNGFGKGAGSSGRLPRDEKKASIGTGGGTIRKDATAPSLPAPRGDVVVPERATGPTGTTVSANSNPKRDVIRVGEGKGVVTGAATDGGASRPVSMPTANISGGTADAIGGTPARSGRASKGAIVTPAITDAVTTSSVIRTAAPTIPVVRMPSSSSITGLNIPKGVGREISINLPPSVSAKQPRGDVVAPKQSAPFVLAPVAPMFTPAPDYCSDPRLAGTELCRRGGDGTFPAVSSACAQSFRDLLARGLSVAEIISGNELCSDEFRRLLAGATPVLIEPPKQGAVAAAKGMPIAVAAPTMIVAPGGAPTAVNPVQCMALFLALPSAAQAAIVGAYPCPMARSLAPEIARGSRAAAADFVQWFGSAFGPASAEVRSFCAAVLNARGVAAAGAPGGIVVHGRAYVQPAGAAKGGASMVLRGSSVAPARNSVAPGVASQGAGPSVAQCLQTIQTIAMRNPRALIAAFSQSRISRRLPMVPGGSDVARAQMILDFVQRNGATLRDELAEFCRSAMLTSGVKPGGAPVRPAGGNAPGVDANAAVEQCIADGGVDCERLRAPAAQPGSSGPSTAQILGGVSSIATTGIGFVNSYLDRENQSHIEELRQNASSANEQIRANAAQEIARIQADAQVRIAALGPNPSQQAVANALNTAVTPPSQGMSTGTTVALAAGGVAIVGGIAYLALSKKGR